jgi:hypothetical protein
MTDKLREAAEKYAGPKPKCRSLEFEEWWREVDGFIAGAHYARRETIAEVLALLRATDHRDSEYAEWFADYIEEKLRAMEGNL